jgi:plasmid stabilization system protein ParE
MKVSWTAYAIEDLRAVRAYIARDSDRFADIVVDRIFARVVQLEAFPESGQMVPEYGRADIREVLLHSYRIIHHVLPDQVQIITVVHGSVTLPVAPLTNK